MCRRAEEERAEGRAEGRAGGREGEGKIHERMPFEERGGIVPLLYVSTGIV